MWREFGKGLPVRFARRQVALHVRSIYPITFFAHPRFSTGKGEKSISNLLLKGGSSERCAGSQFMAKKLYVGNLSWSTNDDSLRKAFSQAGTVTDVVVMSDKMTGKSRGFGFVTIEDGDAEKAILMWNDKELDGRRIRVNEARPLTERPARREY